MKIKYHIAPPAPLGRGDKGGWGLGVGGRGELERAAGSGRVVVKTPPASEGEHPPPRRACEQRRGANERRAARRGRGGDGGGARGAQGGKGRRIFRHNQKL